MTKEEISRREVLASASSTETALASPHLTQEQVAMEAEVETSYLVSALERGQQPPPPEETVGRIVRGLGANNAERNRIQTALDPVVHSLHGAPPTWCALAFANARWRHFWTKMGFEPLRLSSLYGTTGDGRG